MNATDRLLSVALNHLDDGPISYCVDRLMADRWDESSNQAGTAITLKIHLRATRRLTAAEKLIVDNEKTKEASA